MNFFRDIRARIYRAHPDHQAIAKGMAWVALFVLLGSVARAAKEVAIAYRYGVSAEVDAYLFVFNLVTWPVGVWFSVLTVVLVPLSARIRQDASTELPRFRSELLGITLLLGLTLALLGWLGLPLLLRSPWTGLPHATVTVAVEMVFTLTLLAPLGVIIGLFSAWMLAAGRHANTLLESVPALVILLALVAFPGGGAEPLVWGTLTGFAFHLVSLGVPLAKRREIEAPRFTRQSSKWALFWQGFGVMLASQAVMSFTGIIDQFFAAHLGTGAIATLGYANRILSLILGVGAMAIGRATLPIFSQAQLQGEEQVNRIATYWMVFLFVLGVVSMIATWWLAPWAVRLLYGRGAFTAQNVSSVTEVLQYGLLKLPSYFPLIVISSLLASSRKFHVWFFSVVLFVTLRTTLSYMLIRSLELRGLMVADALAYTMSFAFYLAWMKFRREK